MHRFAVRSVHDASFGEPERPLVESNGGFDISHCKYDGHRAILSLVERIDLLGHSFPLCSGILSKSVTTRVTVLAGGIASGTARRIQQGEFAASVRDFG